MRKNENEGENMKKKKPESNVCGVLLHEICVQLEFQEKEIEERIRPRILVKTMTEVFLKSMEDINPQL